MKNSRYTDSIRVFFGLSLLMTSIIVAGIEDFRTSAASTSQETSSKTVSVRLKSQNSPLINLLSGRDLPSAYESTDYSSEQLKAGQTRPLALASADFDSDGFPDLVTGYSSADGGILTLHNGNPEAFAPTTAESFALIREGHFPDSFLEKAQSFAVPAEPDFLVTGDFDRDGNLDVISATRGGDKIYLFSGAGRNGGGFGAWREISLPGRVTAMTAGEFDAADNRTDLLVGVENEAGASLLVFENPETGVFAAPISYQISSPAISLELGKLDDDAFADAVILTGDGVSILHGRNQSAGKESVGSVAARLEKINLPFVPQAMTIGDFIFDRAGKMELALLAEDGSIQIAKRGDLDERPFSVEEAQANRRQRAKKQLLGKLDNNLKTWQPEIPEDWTIDGSMSVADAAASQRSVAAPILMKANLSGQNTDDILFLDSESREIKILSAQNAEQSDGENSISGAPRAVYSLEAASEPIAMLPTKLNIFARPGLVVLQSGKSEPAIVPAAPAATYTVNRTDDINRSVATVCNGAASDCSLREAISKANSSPGADMINVPAGTYTLSLANAGGTNEDNNATGDLDINDSLTITGLGGQAATVVQAGTTPSNGIDKVFASNPFCTSVVNTSFTGLTIRYGRNTQPNGAADFSFTGGGLDWCNTGAGGTLTVTNSTFDSNSATTGPGGGIDLDTASTTSGSVTLTNVTISNNKSQTPTSGGVTVGGDGGGLAILGGVTYNTTITNSTISGNTAGVANNPQRTDNGGGIFFSQVSNSGSSLTVSGTTISNNSAFGGGGGIRFIGATGGTTAFTINQSSVVSGNTSGGSGGTNSLAQGGGLFVEPFAGSATINKTTIVNNVLSASAATNRGGAGIAAGQGNTTVSYCRIVGNTGTTALGTGLNKDINPGTVNAAENWWGCSTGPSAAPCDTAVLTPGSTGTLITSPWIVLRHTASPSTIMVGQSTTLTASFLTDSANNALSLSNITVLLGLPIIFNNPVRGTISNAQTTIQSSGTATATFTATSIGAGSADAIVDNDVAAAGRTNRATITINQAATTTAVSSSQNPSVFGQSVIFTATVSVTAPGAGTPTGTVTFKDNGVNIGGCAAQTISSSTATCTISSLSVGSHPITAVYSGDTNFAGSTSSAVTQVVNKANTTVTITNDTPDPSVVRQAYTVTVSLAVTSPGAGTPTGTVTVSDGTDTCTITLPATSCNLTSTTAGAKILTATYNGDTNFNASPASAGVAHTVNSPPDLTIAKTHTGNFSRSQTGAQYTITVTNSGGSTTSGTVTAVDTLPNGLTATAISGTGWSCSLGTLTCTRSDALAASASYPIITLTVDVAGNAPASVTNTATVSGGGETNTANDTANDPTTVLAPTAADVQVGGQVTTQTGRGLNRAQVTITDQFGNQRTTTTNPFGYFRFADVPAGETYIISVVLKRYSFEPQVINVTDDITDLIIKAQ